jgi:photosystem II stability/assembly factor-like uncharacterized protein
VVNDSTVWFAGGNGKYGRIINSEIEMDSIIYEGSALNFRSIGFNSKHIFILSIENPARLYKIDPFTDKVGPPKLVYQENHEKVFYDAMAFFDNKRGIAMGDPTDNCLSVILTSDGGNTWQKINCKELPEIIEGEAAFAASNSNIAIYKKNVWLVTGGKKARVFYSNNSGKKWAVYDTPIVQGGKMTGIFSVDFNNQYNGIIMGGNWDEKSNTTATKALTRDGGKTWKLIDNNSIPGYISCVKYIPKTKGNELVAVSTEGIFYSENGGLKWVKLSDASFYSINFIDKNSAWLSGHQKIARMQIHKN